MYKQEDILWSIQIIRYRETIQVQSKKLTFDVTPYDLTFSLDSRARAWFSNFGDNESKSMLSQL